LAQFRGAASSAFTDHIGEIVGAGKAGPRGNLGKGQVTGLNKLHRFANPIKTQIFNGRHFHFVFEQLAQICSMHLDRLSDGCDVQFRIVILGFDQFDTLLHLPVSDGIHRFIGDRQRQDFVGRGACDALAVRADVMDFTGESNEKFLGTGSRGHWFFTKPK